MKKIMLVCSGGMSSSLLVTKMDKAAKEMGKEFEIFAVSEPEGVDRLKKDNDISVVLVGPQIRYVEPKFAEVIGNRPIKLAVINMMDYGMMNGEKVLKAAIKLMES
ncbi:PTS sugar transporter subunit IIB [Amygdalobacter nucleatus]|uniref:PTS system, Lactose/Cellobiose specific IIB subunit n=1 Tax=Amygdalobacter nucleatus TaxID=3029274 RepID=A0A133YGX5_9FIRM|nr:PTS sugar transporter subunit IIB [Amygdalobacter nucleatus]KXB42441.1 PTS system, Lactose/Cellobiose specific IIB subunit [Amygdalobacter nucleatus]MDF0486015.1 PTS sugar transporter subunit IIB [Amygdalobacter nucleatus]WEG37428.1 PTS sugar transporter subunit IIB [Amygdalobacter nucleatus]